ncbi:Granule-bound starch synthase 1, chloroplastic/amyloplastic [Apostasia shenzhenica]|uniref:Granule-bound starch synthase 1, chloroplastic/amyloplastic n=1 Tax=Apostasia shenzhenica TaxID=1088818 RepID=A0A2I0AJZ7_9ASPA|nr:Granule-bound starch synthase 1, chloroplastic/amyloplastic [Apostasia shenzhenica]
MNCCALSLNLYPTYFPFFRPSCSPPLTVLPSPSVLPAFSSTPSSSSSSQVPLLFTRRAHSLSVHFNDLGFSSFRAKQSAVCSGYKVISRGEVKQEDAVTPVLEDAQSQEVFKPRRIALFVEPSPFAYVSGYKNRFQNFIKHLREMGDEVMVVTTHEGVPQEFYGAKCIGSLSFPCPWYTKVPLSLALSPRIISEVAKFKPDIIHASSPGIMVFGALAIAKMLCVPIVLSYHTHVPVAADLTLVPSAAIGRDLEAARVTPGVDPESFHPRFRCHKMRVRLSDGESEKPLIIHVGRLGVEKSLDFLKCVMDRLPMARIAFVGDGPYRSELEKMFEGMPAVFTGMLQGEELSQAYASGDVFVMPSESETLGLVVLEAMSSGVPVVAARAGGIIDIISEEQDGKTSFLFKPGDVDDCLKKIERLICDTELRDGMSKAAREETEKYDWKAASSKIRNEQYNAAIWFWRKKRAQLLRPVQWLSKKLFRLAAINYN